MSSKLLRKVGLWTLLCLVGVIQGSAGPTETNSLATPTLILAVGAPGESTYATNFQQQATLWLEAATQGGAKVVRVGGGTNDSDQLQQALDAEPKASDAPLWIVFIGHGTFDGKEARWNLQGPDVTATNLASWLKPFQRPLAIINTASSSSPFLTALAGTNRVVITATRSGYEQNVTRFGKFLAEAWLSPTADLDGDGQTSLLEAFLSASKAVTEFYRAEGLLQTEHALLDDNGDGQGIPADWFRGLHQVKQPKEKVGTDGLRAHQWHLVPSAQERQLSAAARARRNQLEAELAALRSRKAAMPEAEYYAQLEALFVLLAEVYGIRSTPTR